MNKVVVLKYDPTWTALEWAKKHCPSYITNDAKPVEPRRSMADYMNPVYINYYFGNEHEAFLFKLRWSEQT